MSILLTKFNYFNELNLDPDSGVAEEIDDSNSISINLGSEVRNNSMRVNLKNDPIDVFSDGTLRHRWITSDGNNVFKAIKETRGSVINDEVIEVHVAYSEDDPTLDVESNDFLLFPGVITKGKAPFDTNGNGIELNCKDRSVIILDKLTIPQSYKPNDTGAPDGTGWVPPSIIQNLIQNGSENNSNSPAFDSSGNRANGYPFLVDARLFSDFIESSGTATGVSTNTLFDGAATFLSDDIERDDWVRNTVTNQYAYIRSVDSDNQITLSKDIFTDTDGYEISDGFMQDKRPDGTAFPFISFSQIDKPIVEGISKLSQISKLNTVAETNPTSGTLVVRRGARYFIDKRNRFHWYIPNDTPEWVMVVGQTASVSPDTVNHVIHTVEPENEVEDNINFIIFKVGADMNNIQIKSFSRAAFSGTPNVKDSKRIWEHIAREMKQEDAQEGNISQVSLDDYDFPSGYPVTPAWDRQEHSVANDSEYNDNFKEEAIIRGKELAQAIFQKQANPRWKGKILLRGEDIIVGDLVDFTSRAHGLRNLKVRVNQVTHSITSATGWLTTLNFEEDENEAQIIT